MIFSILLIAMASIFAAAGLIHLARIFDKSPKVFGDFLEGAAFLLLSILCLAYYSTNT
jgi:hypothetical protein